MEKIITVHNNHRDEEAISMDPMGMEILQSLQIGPGEITIQILQNIDRANVAKTARMLHCILSQKCNEELKSTYEFLTAAARCVKETEQDDPLFYKHYNECYTPAILSMYQELFRVQMNDRSKWARYEVEMDTHHVRQIIRALYEHRILSNKSLAREVGVTSQNLSNILKRLKDAGMVFVHKTPGRKTVQYSLNPEFKIYYERNYKGKRVKTIHFLKSEFESYEQVQDRFFLFSKRWEHSFPLD